LTKRLAALTLIALVLAPVAFADPPDQDYRCEPIAERALDEASEVLDKVTSPTSNGEAAWRAGQSCYLISHAVENLRLIKCDPELIGLMQEASARARKTMGETNSARNTHGRCVPGGGY
jgi:hypothetical protein